MTQTPIRNRPGSKPDVPRLLRIQRLRELGWSYAKIAAELHIHRSRAHQLAVNAERWIAELLDAAFMDTCGVCGASLVWSAPDEEFLRYAQCPCTPVEYVKDREGTIGIEEA